MDHLLEVRRPSEEDDQICEVTEKSGYFMYTYSPFICFMDGFIYCCLWVYVNRSNLLVILIFIRSPIGEP